MATTRKQPSKRSREKPPREHPRQSKRLYIKEWFDFRGLSDQEVANRLGMERTAIFKWRKQPSRLDPDKMALLASVVQCEPWQLWYPPGAISLDAMLKGESEDRRRQAAELLQVFLKAGRA
jgi:hypothetical protein